VQVGPGRGRGGDYPKDTPPAPGKGGAWRVKARPATRRNEHYRLPTMLSEVPRKCGVRGRTDHHERVNDAQEQEPQGEEADMPHKRIEGGLTSTPSN